MGNTASKVVSFVDTVSTVLATVPTVVDTALRVVCVSTNGQFGKSDQGYHVGPLRLKKDSVGFEIDVGICKANMKIGKNEFGNFSFEGGVTCGIPKVASGTLNFGKESNGIYWNMSGSLDVGTAKANAGVVADSKGNIRSYSAGATGPLLSNAQYSKENGLSAGTFGLSVNKNKEISYAHLENALISKAGEKAKERYQSYGKEKPDNEKKEEKNKSSDDGNEKKPNPRSEKGTEPNQESNIRLRTNKQRNDNIIDTILTAPLTPTEKLQVNRQRDAAVCGTTSEPLTTRIRPVSVARKEIEIMTLGYCDICKGPCVYK